MARGTALVSKARVVQLTGVQDLENVEATGELAIADLLVSASDAIYDQIDGDGIDPTQLANATVYERAVAWHFLALLALNGSLRVPDGMELPRDDQGHADPYAWSNPHMRVKPRLAPTISAPRRASEGVPEVGHVNEEVWPW